MWVQRDVDLEKDWRNMRVGNVRVHKSGRILGIIEEGNLNQWKLLEELEISKEKKKNTNSFMNIKIMSNNEDIFRSYFARKRVRFILKEGRLDIYDSYMDNEK